MATQKTNKIRTNLRKTYDQYAAERDTAGREDWKIEERSLFLKGLEGEGGSLGLSSRAEREIFPPGNGTPAAPLGAPPPNPCRFASLTPNYTGAGKHQGLTTHCVRGMLRDRRGASQRGKYVRLKPGQRVLGINRLTRWKHSWSW